MKRKALVFVIILAAVISVFIWYFLFRNHDAGRENKQYTLPQVLFITTGSNQGNGVLAEGVVVALQSFNKQGAYVTLSSRDILLKPEKLKEFHVLILPTGGNYHDADRKYSLTFLSDTEMHNIKNWVNDGGILIAGDNIGRNTIEGVDRTNLTQKLTPSNWILGECFGVALREKNMKGFDITGNIADSLQGTFIPASGDDQWALVIDSLYSKNLKTLAHWSNDTIKIPALIQNSYGKGKSFLLPTFYLLHPANDGGYWSEKKIHFFYDYILREYYGKTQHEICLNPWPYARNYAFCVTLNAAGNEENFEKVFSLLDQEKINPTVFVDGNSTDAIRNLLLQKKCNLQSNGFQRFNYRKAAFPETMKDIMFNENHWGIKFTGFRFPFTFNSFWGMKSLQELGYKFDSSIGADNIDAFYGSIFPYNIPISNASYYTVLDLYEISPIFHDDYHFYKDFVETKNYSGEKQKKDAELFEKYLFNYWEHGVKPYGGAMVFIGHPLYTGRNDTTLKPLAELIKIVKAENTWIATVEDLAVYWKELGLLQILVQEKERGMHITINAPVNIKVSGMTLRLKDKPSRVKVKLGNYTLSDRNNQTYLSLDGMAGQEVELHY